jgi:membrane dipeptidase
VTTDPDTLHDDAIIIDAACPLAKADPKYLEWYREGGTTALAPTIASTESAALTLERLAAWHHRLRARSDLILARFADDICRAKQTGCLALYFHLQGADPIEDNLDLIYLYKSLGVGMVQLTYNVRNRVGDGCESPADDGVSAFGRDLIACLNEAGIIVDCSHAGKQTTLDALELSRTPVVLSHTNAAAVHRTRRNAPPELLRAVAAAGGVIGVAGFPGMLGKRKRPTLDDLMEHIDALVDVAGIDHVGLGLDYYPGQAGVAADEEALRRFAELRASGTWSEDYPSPPHNYPAGIETPRTLCRLTQLLVARGYNEGDVRKILGGNWLRVMRTVWDGVPACS